jgi:hypothetical protein
MSLITNREGGVTMYKRTFKALLVVAVLGVAFPVSAAAMPLGDSGGAAVVPKATPTASVVTKHPPIVSEKVAGLGLPVLHPTVVTKHPTIVSEKTAGLNLSTQQPTENVATTSTTSFDWGDFGIGAAAMLGALLAVVATAGVVRRHQHAHLAH